jgi:hypothetical protein
MPFSSDTGCGRPTISTAKAVDGGDEADVGSDVGVGAAAGVGAGAEIGDAATAAPLAASVRITLPSDTLSPSFTRSDCTTPAAVEGISIDALSDSTVMSDWSLATVSPALTNTSMISTSLKSPMSGTFTSIMPPLAGATAGAV